MNYNPVILIDTQYSRFLDRLIQHIDITRTQYLEAVERYEAVGKFLENSEYTSAYDPDIYTQGSFMLGTVVKPMLKDEFDIDLVCLLKNIPSQFSQKDLKNTIGKAFINSDRYKPLLQEEGRRCWTLKYAEATRFHLDVLPAVADDIESVFQMNVEYDKAQYSIKITDKTSDFYHHSGLKSCPKSNPKGYGFWFREQMEVQYVSTREKVFSSNREVYASVEDVPFFEVKTTLQQSIQILKRHRDVMFGDDEDKPISIIITTLAAKAYKNKPDLFESLSDIVLNMEAFIENRNGEKWVENPVRKNENFADKWTEYPEREDNFYLWLNKVKEDLINWVNSQSIDSNLINLQEVLGEKAVNAALKDFGFNPTNHKQIARQQNPLVLTAPHKKKIPWKIINEQKEVTLNASYKNNRKVITLKPNHKVPKNRHILFRASTNVSGRFDIYWQVVNTGLEARNNAQLRGSIEKGSHKNLKWQESTRYKGYHSVECFIVQNDVCMARSGEFIVYIEEF